MKKTIYFSKRAKIKLRNLLEYLESKWSVRIREKFISKLDGSIEQICMFPESCLESENFPGIRKCVVTRQTSLYYRINEGVIEVITLIDNRQDPDKLKAELGL